MAFDLTCLQTFQANSRARVSSGVGGRWVTTLRSTSCRERESASCNRIPPEIFFRTHFCGAAVTSTRRRFFFAGELCLCGFVEGGRGDHFEEEFVHFFGGFGVDGTVHTDHAAERGDGIAFESALVGFGESFAGGCAAGIGVLDDGADRFVEFRFIKFLGEIPGGLQVDDVIEGKFFSLNLAGIGHADGGAVRIHGGLLMRIFTVAQVEGFLE